MPSYYFAPTTSLVMVPVRSKDAPFIVFAETSAKFHRSSSFRGRSPIVYHGDPAKTAKLLNYTVQNAKLHYLSGFHFKSLSDFGVRLDSYDEYSYQQVRGTVEKLGKVQLFDRKYLPNFIFELEDIILAIGQDGLVANTLKYLEDQPVIGVTPPMQIAGMGCCSPFKPKKVEKGGNCRRNPCGEAENRGSYHGPSVDSEQIRATGGDDFFIGQ